MSTQSREQRVRDAEEAARRAVGCHLLTTWSVHVLVQEIINAYDPMPKPKWPTDEMIKAANFAWGEADSEGPNMRKALLAARAFDPLVHAAIDMRDVIRTAVGPVGRDDAEVVQAVIDAVNEAGL